MKIKFLSVNLASAGSKRFICLCYSLINIWYKHELSYLKHGQIYCIKRPKFNGLFSLTSLFLTKLRNNFFGKYFLLNGHVYFLLFLFDYDFMAQDFAFVIFNSFYDLLLFDLVCVKQAIWLL